jgi:pimeloyl-ACP methyl ester carboxylesterase
LREVLQLIVPRPRARAVRGISCPVTLVIGDIGEPVFRRTTRRVHRLVPAARLVTVSSTSHLIPVDQPRLFADAVAEALGMGNGANSAGYAGQ